MDGYIERVIKDLPMKIIRNDTDLTPSRNDIFEKDSIKSLGKKETEEFHTSVARGMFVAMIESPDIHKTAVVLSTSDK